MKIIVKPIGKIDQQVLEELKTVLIHTFGCPVTISPEISLLERAYNRDRGQYLTTWLLSTLKTGSGNKLDRVIGVTNVSLYSLNFRDCPFVFGQADTEAGVAIISLAQLQQELPPDYELFLKRAAKEAVHELGHTFGLEHCQKIKCVMHFSNSLHDTDLKDISFCSQCQPKLIQ